MNQSGWLSDPGTWPFYSIERVRRIEMLSSVIMSVIFYGFEVCICDDKFSLSKGVPDSNVLLSIALMDECMLVYSVCSNNVSVPGTLLLV